MREFSNIDLAADPLAAPYVKSETVDVEFAREDGELASLEGPNRFRPGDALITGSTGSRWAVARERFGAKYEPESPTAMGEDGRYRARPLPVLARQVDESFRAQRSVGGDWLQGKPGDWLLQYGPGDFGVAEQERFARIYRKLD